jgi:hypothetical protein
MQAANQQQTACRGKALKCSFVECRGLRLCSLYDSRGNRNNRSSCQTKFKPCHKQHQRQVQQCNTRLSRRVFYCL